MITLGTIARRQKVPLHKVQYVVRSRKIKPETRVGNVGLYSKAAEKRIAVELRRIERRNVGIGK